MNQPQNNEWQDLVTDVDGFWNEESCPNVKGKLVSITEMELARRPTIVAVIMLTAPAKGVIGSKDEKQTVDLEPGQAIGVVVKHKLQDLYSMLQNQCEVDITAKEKITLENGNQLWRYAIRYRGQRVMTAAPRSRQAERGPAGTPEQEAEKGLASV